MIPRSTSCYAAILICPSGDTCATNRLSHSIHGTPRRRTRQGSKRPRRGRSRRPSRSESIGGRCRARKPRRAAHSLQSRPSRRVLLAASAGFGGRERPGISRFIRGADCLEVNVERLCGNQIVAVRLRHCRIMTLRHQGDACSMGGDAGSPPLAEPGRPRRRREMT